MEKTENKWIVDVWIVRIIRLTILALAWSSILIGIIRSGDLGFMFSTYTIQSNCMVAVWLTIAIIFQESREDHWFFSEVIRGAVTMYITVTFIVFAILLSPYYHPTGIEAYTNLGLHYIVPVAFIVDWVFTELHREYQWKFIVFWLAYPIFYLVLTLVRGAITGNYIYYFLDLSIIGVPMFIMLCFILAGVFLCLGALFVFINKKLRK